GGQRVAFLRRLAAARLDDVAHARPFVEPGCVVAEPIAQRTADPVDLVDLGTARRRSRQAEQQAHRPAVVGREIDEGRFVLAVARWCLSLGWMPRGDGASSHHSTICVGAAGLIAGSGLLDRPPSRAMTAERLACTLNQQLPRCSIMLDKAKSGPR